MDDGAHAAAARLVVVADDLTGAVESAALLVAPDGTSPRVLLGADRDAIASALREPGALVVDADLRHLDDDGARRRLAGILDALPADVEVLVKIDSLLRGPLSGVAAALAGRAPVLCTAVPATRRTVVDGVVHVDDLPLHRTGAWRAETHDAPADVLAATASTDGAVGVVVPLSAVRRPGLAELLARIVADGGIALADAETDDDLAAIAAAAPGVLVGAAGLAEAWAARYAHVRVPDPHDLPTRPDPLALIGTASDEAAAQIDACAAAGIATLRPPVAAIAAADPAVGVPAIVAAPRERVDPRLVERGFAALASRVAGERDLVLSGGATARAVLEALGIRTLRPIAELHHGAVASLAGSRRVITRPGSYGDPTSLQAALGCLASGRQEHP